MEDVLARNIVMAAAGGVIGYSFYLSMLVFSRDASSLIRRAVSYWALIGPIFGFTISTSLWPRHEGLELLAISVIIFVTILIGTLVIAAVREGYSEKGNAGKLGSDELSKEGFWRGESAPEGRVVDDVTSEDALYEMVHDELFGNRTIKKSLWTRLYSELSGDEVKVRSSYIGERIEQLREEAVIAREGKTREIKKQKEIDESKRRENEISKFDKGGALSYANLSFMITLVEMGEIDVNRQEAVRGNTLLHCCAKNGAYKLAKRLLELGADPKLRDGSGRTPEQCTRGEETQAYFAEIFKRS